MNRSSSGLNTFVERSLMLKILEWDSSFFGKIIADLNTADIIDWTRFYHFVDINNIDIVQCLAPSEDIKFTRELEENGFRYVDTRMCFSLSLPYHCIEEYHKKELSEATMVHFDEISNIAERIFIRSRYNNDYFSISKSREFYSLWLKNAIRSKHDDKCLFISKDNEITGFITIKTEEDNAKIGLIGVKKEYQGHGIGSSLIYGILNYISGHKNINDLLVVTQGNNYQAINFYIKHGFLVKYIKHWFYWARPCSS